ncbi:PREDICTED: pentatricopeptide repeat-containing protein At1g33350 [Tarenaya hassleriana]|uniref:pentatricopeptide repeat-containing protein At1g33350 n=1 Tax=Tarenaya hassleriana TaxID=28532 RepID=UPI00053C5633|nr:PREDICTED: pentatricopeptide repeat-containing protein At1g33350 [Tarenaya hassleriana]XP_019057248.1 PREDICTED: pentatricopeptide repeat-containing protein At1g33350 [Tarenaya hassleriana]
MNGRAHGDTWCPSLRMKLLRFGCGGSSPADTAEQFVNRVVSAVLSRSTHLNHLKQVQSFIIAVGLGRSPFLCFKLIRFCTLRLCSLSYARLVFDHFSSPNIYLYTAVLTAYSSSLPHHASSAFSLFRLMLRRSSPRPNQFIYPHVFKCTPYLSSAFSTPLVHTHSLKSGFHLYIVVRTAMLHSYASSTSHIPFARQLFDEMSDRNVVSWTAMVSGYARSGDISNALSLFREMPDRDIPSWNAILAACTQNGLFPEAISLFRRMIKEPLIRPNAVSLVCVLSACAQTGMLQLARGIHAFVYRHSLSPDLFVSNALVDVYGKCGNFVEANTVFGMTSKKSSTAWNSMINCFALHGRSEEAIAVFEEMMKLSDDDIKPDGITFIGLLNACTHAGLVENGCAYFDLMTNKLGIEPRIEHYGCLIDLLGRAGRFDEALEVISGMWMEPDEVVWGSLLNACKIYGRLDFAEVAVKNLVALQPSNGGYVAMMANLYGELGKWEEAHRARRMIKDQNACKTPGCSWIEIDNRVHQFYSLDKSHPKTEEIYFILESLICFETFERP